MGQCLLPLVRLLCSMLFSVFNGRLCSRGAWAVVLYSKNGQGWYGDGGFRWGLPQGARENGAVLDQWVGGDSQIRMRMIYLAVCAVWCHRAVGCISGGGEIGHQRDCRSTECVM